jgi:4'-phosphopantetheinyl transferase
VDWPAGRLAMLAAWLDPTEQERAARFRFSIDRAHFIARRALLRAILSRLLGLPPQSLVYQTGPYGKPALFTPPALYPAKPSGLQEGETAGVSAGTCLKPSDLRFSLSHSDGLVLVAVSIGRELGVDLEQIRRDFDYSQVAQQFYSPAEQAMLRSLPADDQPWGFYNAWTRKEAYIKAIGLGLSLPLDDFVVSLHPDEPARLLDTRQGLPGADTWTLFGLEPAPDYAGAVCAQGQDWELQTFTIDDPPDWVTRSLSQGHFG